jgi:hypothetical protein
VTLLSKLVPAIPWIPWLPAGVGIAVLSWVAARVDASFGSRQLYVRGGLLLAALALSFAFDDPAAETSDPTPSPLRIRRSLRLLVSLAPWATLVAVVLLAGAWKMEPVMVLSAELDPFEFPVGRLILEAATVASWGLATAAILTSRSDDEPGKIASGAVLVLYAAAWMVPERWKPWAHPTDSRWVAALPWWWVALGVGLVVVVAFGWDSRKGGGWGRLFRRYGPKASQSDDTPATIEPNEAEAVRG